MAEQTIIDNMISRPGQSQGERMPTALEAHHADIDERNGGDLLRFLHRLAAQIRFYGHDPDRADGDWAAFLPGDDEAIKRLLTHDAGTAEPHQALLAAFVELYNLPQELINRITGRHLDFFYCEVLRLAGQGPRTDRAHLLFELKKNAEPLIVGPVHRFFVGKQRVYAPEGETVLNHGRVVELRSFFVDAEQHGRVLMAPVANSADGLGGALDPADPKWFGFGRRQLPQAAIGFGLAAPVLRLRQGDRTITLRLRLAGSMSHLAGLDTAFELYLSGEKRWLGPFHPDEAAFAKDPAQGLARGAAGTGLLTLKLVLPAGEKAVVDYDSRIHGGGYAVQAPIVQVLVRESCTTVGYKALRGLIVTHAEVGVAVAGMAPDTVANDHGALDAAKVFLPFGNQPVAGSRLAIGCPEALDKHLSELRLTIRWHDAPGRFATRYDGYQDENIGNQSFTARIAFQDGGSWQCSQAGEALFAKDATQPQTLTFKPPASQTVATSSSRPSPSSPQERLQALQQIKTRWAFSAARSAIMLQPALATGRSGPEAEERTVVLVLERGFLHAEYRKQCIEQVVSYSKQGKGDLKLIAEPYTPAIRELSLGYEASSGSVALEMGGTESLAADDCLRPDLQFFHLTPFGRMREHGFLRSQAGLTDTRVRLLPAFDHEGELLIGLARLQGGDSASLLFQVAEGSADPTLAAQPVLWSVLCDNYWQPLGEQGVVRDTTNNLRTSGIITFVFPQAATTENTILPEGLIWLRGAVARNTAAMAQLIEVAANAVEVRQPGIEPMVAAAALPAGSIDKMRDQPAAIKVFRQPYAVFGGRAAESEAQFRTRTAERLRHKNRCITPWDYERIVLAAFPGVHRVKCIPHATDGCWLAPGNVLLVVVPDLRNRNGVNPLQPMVDADTLARIADHVGSRIGGQVHVWVRNPRYQRILLDFKVRLHRGHAFNTYSQELNRAIIGLLSPWTLGEAGRDLGFGGTIYKSVLLDWIEDLPYVDAVEEMRLHTGFEDPAGTADLDLVRPLTPDAVLVSVANHRIGEAGLP
ncbi:baseplate J/gp47 family protein [Desulfobulbus sp.]|uniref:baseplate J/gp47 family protein n=1 Tax=Desulfobulbus sp. TaxID=895 RepID=UPI00286EE436|nr:baseplate J/gp47 family protein [Desulfobulbus sp.]